MAGSEPEFLRSINRLVMSLHPRLAQQQLAEGVEPSPVVTRRLEALSSLVLYFLTAPEVPNTHEALLVMRRCCSPADLQSPELRLALRAAAALQAGDAAAYRSCMVQGTVLQAAVMRRSLDKASQLGVPVLLLLIRA